MIETHPIEDLIGAHPLFRDVGEEICALLSSCAHNTAFHDGEDLMREGAPADVFYLVRAGRVALQVEITGRGPAIIQTASEGDAVGLSWLIPPYVADFTARAVGPVRATALDAKCLRTKCEADPRVGYALYKALLPSLIARLRTARLQALDIYAPPAVGGAM